MLKKLFIIIIILTTLTGCKNKDVEPDIAQIRNISNMATIETTYHNVAKSTKTAAEGFAHIGEKDREFWIEYEGVVKIGVDMSKININIKGDTIKIEMPQAEVLEVYIDYTSFDKDSFISSDDSWFNKNKITAQDQTEAINKAQQKIKKATQEDKQLLLKARTRAEEMIKSYINQISDISGKKYTIKWEYLEQ